MITDMENTAASMAMPAYCRLFRDAEGAAWKAACAAGTRLDMAMWHRVRNTGCWKFACMSRYLRHVEEGDSRTALAHDVTPLFTYSASFMTAAVLE